MKVLSLFDGISCGMVALEKLGITPEVYDAYEIDEDAIKISNFNYPMINHCGDVFKAKYTPYSYDLLIGGSPCTYWSIAQNKDKRETTASGLGWDLFSQYVRALHEAKPIYFLYENNFSMSNEIRDCITKELGVAPIMINSSVCSAQNRKRYYWTNIPFEMPVELGLKFNELIKIEPHAFRPVGNWVYTKWGDKRKLDMLGTINDEKAHTLTTSKTHSWQYYTNPERTMYTNLSVHDFEMLQTLPIGYCDNVPVREGAKYKAIGNGWTINVIVSILKGIRRKENEQ